MEYCISKEEEEEVEESRVDVLWFPGYTCKDQWKHFTIN